ncbi:MAG: hypothetical protein IAE89_16655 [Anaerolineae bacterium]|nr:hypothetical protein [Anaerolineae bacterium]
MTEPRKQHQWAGILLLVAALACGLILGALALDTLSNPLPVSLNQQQPNGSIRFTIDRTRSLFAADCLHLAWSVNGASEVLIAEAPAAHSGERPHCDGTAPSIRVTFEDGQYFGQVYYHWALFDQIAARGLLFGAGLFAAAGLWLIGAGAWRIWKATLAQYGFIILFAVIFTVTLDLFTNSLNTYRFTWDWVHYLDMAEHGITGNTGLVSPYAYRPLPPLLAGMIGDFSGRSHVAGFRTLAYAGAIGQIVLAFTLARLFITRRSRQFWGAFALAIIAAVSTFSVKFYLFDTFRTDPLAFPLVLLGMIGLTQHVRRAANGQSTLGWDAAILLSGVIGALIREFAAIPAGLLIVVFVQQAWRERSVSPLIKALIASAILALAFLLPRLLIQVGRSDQLFDVITMPELVTMWRRNLNLALGLLIALLPVWMLLTPRRLKAIWRQLTGLRLSLFLYIMAILTLSFLGGTDISRFMAFLMPVVIILCAILVNEARSAWEIVYAVLAWAIYNRPFSPVPMSNLDAYLDFYVVYWNRQTDATWLRVGEAAGWVMGAILVRALCLRKRHEYIEAKPDN